MNRLRSPSAPAAASPGGDARVLLGICAALIAIALAGEAGQRLLRYDRVALASGELWRLLTAHVTHLGLRHALLNCLGLALVWALFARDYTPRAWALIALASAVAIDAGLWLRSSTILWYVGSSGVLHGALAAGAIARLRAGAREGWVLAGALAVKLGWEQGMGALPLAGDVPVVVDAHLYGALGGALAAAFLRPRSLPL